MFWWSNSVLSYLQKIDFTLSKGNEVEIKEYERGLFIDDDLLFCTANGIITTASCHRRMCTRVHPNRYPGNVAPIESYHQKYYPFCIVSKEPHMGLKKMKEHTLTAIISLAGSFSPWSGLSKSINRLLPQVLQNWWFDFVLLNLYEPRFSSPVYLSTPRSPPHRAAREERYLD